MLSKMFLFNLVQFSLLKNHISKEGENHENKKANCNSCITASNKNIVKRLSSDFVFLVEIINIFCMDVTLL